MQRSKLIRGYLFVVASAVIYGCMPLMAKYIYLEGVTPPTLVFLRNLLALPSLALLAALGKKPLRAPKKALPSIGMLALLGCCVTPMLLFASYQYIASGTATVFHFIYPAMVAVFGALFLRERLRAATALCVVLCVAGIALFYTPGQLLNVRGSLLALLSGVTFSCYVLLLSRYKYREVTGFVFSFFVAAISSALMLLICLITGQLSLPVSLKGWALCLLFATAVTTGAVVLFQQGAFLIGGQRASILSALEPLTGVFVGALVFHEAMGVRTVLGSGLVILSTLLLALLDMRSSQKQE